MDEQRAAKITAPKIALAKIALVDKCENGLLLTFSDGKCALYSDELLRELFSRAEEWPDPPPDPEA